MASGNVNLGIGDWVDGADGANLTGKNLMFANLGGNSLKVKGSTGSKPTDDSGHLPLGPKGGTSTATTIDKLFPGQSYTNLWFWSDDGGELSFIHD